MIREIIIAPVIAIFVIGFAIQLIAIAESSSNKVLDYADGMNDALDCALRGISIYNCSPQLRDYDFKNDTREFRDVNSDHLEGLKHLFSNATIIKEEGIILIKYNQSR